MKEKNEISSLVAAVSWL